jgi:hypothetical protein
MKLNALVGRLFGRHPAANATLDADRARQQSMHGQAVNQTAAEQEGMRQRMEADVDAQRAQREHGTGQTE